MLLISCRRNFPPRQGGRPGVKGVCLCVAGRFCAVGGVGKSLGCRGWPLCQRTRSWRVSQKKGTAGRLEIRVKLTQVARVSSSCFRLIVGRCGSNTTNDVYLNDIALLQTNQSLSSSMDSGGGEMPTSSQSSRVAAASGDSFPSSFPDGTPHFVPNGLSAWRCTRSKSEPHTQKQPATLKSGANLSSYSIMVSISVISSVPKNLEAGMVA